MNDRRPLVNMSEAIARLERDGIVHLDAGVYQTPKWVWRAMLQTLTDGSDFKLVDDLGETRDTVGLGEPGVECIAVPGDPRAIVTGQGEPLVPVRIIIDADEAALLLGCTREALYTRVRRGQIKATAVVRTGRRVQFHRERLLEPRARR